VLMAVTMVHGWSRCPLQCQPRDHCQWNLLRATCYCRIHYHDTALLYHWMPSSFDSAAVLLILYKNTSKGLALSSCRTAHGLAHGPEPLAVLRRAQADMAAEQAAEKAGILIAHFVGDGFDRQGIGLQHLLGFFQAHGMYAVCCINQAAQRRVEGSGRLDA
jgi:hypothetical protein